MKFNIKSIIRIILVLSCVGVTKIRPANFDKIEQMLAVNARRLELLHAKASTSRVQLTAPQKQTKKVHFAPTVEVKVMQPKRTIDLLLQNGFAKRTQKLWSYEGQAFLKNKPNVSPKLINFLKHGHSLYVFKRNLRHISTQKIIQSLESYLRCNRDEQLKELLNVLKQGNYYEI